MAVRIAFLRGMNLGGRRISNADLASAFAAIGLEGVVTYRASGNVIFEATERSEAKLVATIEAGLREALGYEVPSFVRTAAELKAIAGLAPFDDATLDASTGKLQVILLGSKPRPPAREEALALATGDDLLAMGERELLWLPSGGLRDSGLDVGALERLVGTTTIRTMGTVEGLVAKLPGGPG